MNYFFQRQILMLRKTFEYFNSCLASLSNSSCVICEC